MSVVPSFISATLEDVARQAREAASTGMKMSEFFEWAVTFIRDKRGIELTEEIRDAVIAAWDDAFSDARDAELDKAA